MNLDRAIEAAAEALHEAWRTDGGYNEPTGWDAARIAVEAAAPHILGQSYMAMKSRAERAEADAERWEAMLKDAYDTSAHWHKRLHEERALADKLAEALNSWRSDEAWIALGRHPPPTTGRHPMTSPLLWLILGCILGWIVCRLGGF